MKESECAQRILDWAIREAIKATTDYQQSRCNEESRQSASKLWKEFNPEDGVGSFSQNPYEREKDYNIKRIEKDAETAKNAHEVLEFAKKKICNLIDGV